MRRPLLFLFSLILFRIGAQVPPFQWAKGIAGSMSDAADALVSDPDGNTYLTGGFHGTMDFDPGPGSFILTSMAGGPDIFILKLSPNGNFIWAKQIGSLGIDQGHSICLDPFGQIILTGVFGGSTDFDPGPGNFVLNASGGSDIFVCKLNTQGNLVWAKAIGNAYAGEYGRQIVCDPKGNIYSTGNIIDQVDFDPGPGTAILGNISGSQDAYIWKLDSLGNFIWARVIGGVDNDTGANIELDGAGNVYATGVFKNTIDLDPGPGTLISSSKGARDIYIIKFDNSANIVWGKTIGGKKEDFPSSIRLDQFSNCFITGIFSDTTDFDPGPGVYPLIDQSTLFPSAFILKLDAAGNFNWAHVIGGAGAEGAPSMVIDQPGNVYVSGSFGTVTDFDFGPAVYTLNPIPFNSYIFKVDGGGNFGWAKSVAGRVVESGKSLARDTAGNFYINSYFENTIDFDPGPAVASLSSTALDDIAIQKLGKSSLVGISEYNSAMGICVYPNPFYQTFNIDSRNKATSITYRIFDSLGKLISAGTERTIDLVDISPGIYFLEVTDKYGAISTKKIVKQ